MENFWKLYPVGKLLKPLKQQQQQQQQHKSHRLTQISEQWAGSTKNCQQAARSNNTSSFKGSSNDTQYQHQQYDSNEQQQQQSNCQANTSYAHAASIYAPTPQQQQQNQQQITTRATTTTAWHQQQLTTAAAAAVDNFRFSVLYTLVATSASAFTFNMQWRSLCGAANVVVAATDDNKTHDNNDKALLNELKCRKAITMQHHQHSPHYPHHHHHQHRLLHASGYMTAAAGSGPAAVGGISNNVCCYLGNLDTRSIFYLSLLLLIYCSVLIRASAASSTTTSPLAPLLENKTTNISLEPYELPPLLANQNNSSSVLPLNATFANATVARNSTTAATNEIALIERDNLFAGVNDRDVIMKQHVNVKRDAANVPDEEDDSAYHDDEFDEYDALINNKSAKGKYIGAPCYSDMTCEPTLLHVHCDKETQICGCEKNYPVQLGRTKGCAKPKKLGEQCFYDETCIFNDENSLCVQVRHNALCQCASGYHSVSYTKPTKRVFCTQDLDELGSDLPTLLGVTTGIAVLAGLICMVLHLFSKTKYPRHRNFGDANLPPPIMYSSETGIPLTVQSGRPSSRSSLRSSGSIGSYGNRRASSGGGGAGGAGAASSGGGNNSAAKGILVSTSRTGSRRPSLASVHSTSSSVRSYSMMRFEKEAQQKEIRQEMKLRLARLQQQQHLNQNKPQIVIGDVLHHGAVSLRSLSGGGGMPTPSPMTPNSTDELLPAVDELQEYPLRIESNIPIATTTTTPSNTNLNKQPAVAAATLNALRQVASSNMTVPSGGGGGGTTTTTPGSELAAIAAYIGPCSSSTEAL